MENGDTIYGLQEWLTNWCYSMDDQTYSFIIRTALILLVIVSFLQIAIEQGNKSKGIQLLLVLVGFYLIAGWRIPVPSYTPRIKGFIVLVSVFTILSFPALLPKKMMTRLHIEQKSVWVIYGLILLLFIMQISGSYR